MELASFDHEEINSAVAHLLKNRGMTREDAQDLVQEALVRLVERSHWVQNPGAYVLVVARNLWRDELRKRRMRARAQPTLDAFYGEQCESRDAFRLRSGEESIQDLLTSLDQMPAGRRDAWRSVRVLGEPYKRVARRWGLSVKAIEKTIGVADRQLTSAPHYHEWGHQGSDRYLSLDGSCSVSSESPEADRTEGAQGLHDLSSRRVTLRGVPTQSQESVTRPRRQRGTTEDKKPRLTPKGRALMVKRLESGERPREVAEEMGVSLSTLRKWLRRHLIEGPQGLHDRLTLRGVPSQTRQGAIEPRRQRRATIHTNARLTPAGRALMLKRLEAGQRQRDVAREMGVSLSTLWKWLRRYRREGVQGLDDRSSRRPNTRRVPAHTREAVIKLHRQGRTGRFIAGRLALSATSVLRILRAFHRRESRSKRARSSDRVNALSSQPRSVDSDNTS